MIYLRPLLLLMAYLLTLRVAEAQVADEYISNYDKIIPETPNAASLGQYGSLPVDHSTGVPQISIPIYTVQEDGASVPISLSYHASGVGVDELATAVGLKWSLNAGGGVFRTVREKADEIGWLDPSRRGIVDNTWFSDPNNSVIDLHSHDDLRTHLSLYDHYPDLFRYSIPGYSGDFQFDQSGIARKAYLDGVRIDKTYQGTDLHFKLLDPVGNTYIFNTVREENRSEIVLGTDLGELLSSNRAYEDTGWMLEQIVTKNGETIDFTYESYQLDYEIAQMAQSITKAPECVQLIGQDTTNLSPAEQASLAAFRASQEDIEKCGCEYGEIGDPTLFFEYRTSTSRILRPVNQLISSIETNTVRVDFNYSDLTSASHWKRKLDEIVITDKINNKQKSFSFSYDTFPGDPRLRLNNIQEIGFEGGTKPPYQFTYFGDNLPNKGSKSKDYHGFYNGKTNSTLVPFTALGYKELPTYHRSTLADRNPSYVFLRRGTLKSIQYPTGGTTEFEYELNSEAVATGGNTLYLQPNKFIDTQADQPQFIDGNGNHVYRKSFSVTNAPFSTDGIPSGYTSSSTIFTDPQAIGGSLFNIYRVEGPVETPVLSPTGKVINNDGDVILLDGNYILELVVSPADYAILNGSSTERERVEIEWWEEDTQQLFYAGGLRIKSIKNFESAGDIDPVSERLFEYSGLIGNPSLNDVKNKYFGEKIIFSDENQVLDADLIKSGHFYTDVTIKQIGEGTFLKTKETFESKPYKDKYQGQMTSKISYDELDNPLETQTLDYDITNENTIQYWAMGEVDVCVDWLTGNLDRNSELGFRDPINRVFTTLSSQLKSEAVANYNPTSTNTATVNTTYTYNDNQQVLTVTKSKSGSGTIRQENSYADEYTELNHLTSGDKHLIGIPVSRMVFNGIQVDPVMGQFFEFDSNGNVIRDYRYHRGGGSNTSTLYTNNNYQLELVNEFQLSEGLPIGIKGQSGITTTYIWSYQGDYPVAKIENATVGAVASALGVSSSTFSNYPVANLSNLDNLRTLLPNAMVTTFQYDPLIGMIETKDPNGNKGSYRYDDLGRLIEVLDNNDKLIQSIQYFYSN